MTPQIKIKLDPGAEMPKRAHATDVGADIKALHTWLVQGDGTEHPLRTPEDCQTAKARRLDVAKIKIDTGVHATPPPGFYIELVPNSRLAKSPFMFANSLGIIDPDYTGSMRVILNTVNSLTPEDLEKFLPGNVVGQLILRRRYEADFIQVDELEETERGDGGFGSTEKALQRLIETEGPKWAAVRDAAKYQRFMRGDEIPEHEVFYLCHECRHFTQDPTAETSCGRCPHSGLTPPHDLFRGDETAEDCSGFEKREEHCCGTCDYFRNGKLGIDCCAAFQCFTYPGKTACDHYECGRLTN